MAKIATNGGMNKLLLAVVLLLICLGVAVVYSSSYASASTHGFGAEHYMMNHLPKAVFGIIVMLLVGRYFDYSCWRLLGRVAFVVGMVLTLATILKGADTKGANRWIFGIQPSEILKLGLFVCLADKLSQAGDNIKSIACSVVQPGIFYGITVVLLVCQPNYSMAILVTVIVASVMLAAGANLKYMGIAAAAMVPVGLIKLWTSTHSKARLMAFFADEGEMVASNYQGDNALQALGNGGLLGTGFGQGVQKLGYLPEAHKDVVYAVVGEEFGFIRGSLVLLILFAVLFSQGFNIARNSSTRFGKYLALSLTLSLFCNFAIHVCVCVGLFPTTGQPLPFLSYGGTNLIFNCVVVGILLNISRPNTGKRIKEPYMSGASLESSAYRNYEFRSGV